MRAQNTTNGNPSAAGPVPKRKDEYYNKGAEEDPDATNLEGIPEEAAEGTADVTEEKHEEAEEAEEAKHASEEEEREKELEFKK